MRTSVDHLKNIPTPFYFYDMELLSRTLSDICEETKDAPDFHVHYAIKANANPRILKAIAEAGFGADCVSGGEIKAAISAGFPAEKIVFAGVGKNDEEIRLGLETGISCFNVESLPELEVISQLAVRAGKTANIAFRINPNVDAHTHEKITTGLNENKFGIAMEDTFAAIARAKELPNINYTGLHFHIGSQITDLTVYRHLCQRINDLQEQLEEKGIATSSINVGGGLGISYEDPQGYPVPDFKNYFELFRSHLQLHSGQTLHFELGRSIVAQCGSLIAKVLYVKKGHAKQFLILDAGFTELIRPAMYQAYHQIENISKPTSNSSEHYDVVGPICESSDVFGKEILLPVSERGDLIALRSAGAYGEIMASTYNCRPLPKSYFSSDFK